MESSSIGGRIQISEACRALLPKPYQTEKRGTVAVKGKGSSSLFAKHLKIICNYFRLYR
jgi:hypothetical protein